MTHRIGTNRISDSAITTAKISANSVTNDKIADFAFTSGKIADYAVTTIKLGDASVTGQKIAANTITSDKINPGLLLPSPTSNTGRIITSDGTSAVFVAQSAIRIDASQLTGSIPDPVARNQANAAYTRANNSINANTGGTITGDLIISSNVTTTSLTITANSTSLGFFAEKTNVITAAAGLTTNNTYSLSDGVVHYHTQNSTANSTINLTGFTNVPVGNSVGMAVIVTNNTAPKYISAVQIDGTTNNVSIKWSGGSAPTSGATSNNDVYSFSVVKTASPNTFVIFGSKTQFG
jgi:hypothetical protein